MGYGFRFPWTEPETFVPDFTDVDVYLDPDGNDWRLTVVAMPMNRILTKDLFPEYWKAEGRANDFQHLMRTHWPSVRVHKKYNRPARGPA